MSTRPDETQAAESMAFRIPVRTDLVILPKPDSTPMDRSVEMRRIRKHHVLNLVRQTPGLSRADIAKKAGLNLPSVATLVDELVIDGLVREEEARPSIRGRRPIPVILREDAASVLGIDIGKNSTTMLLVNLVGETLVSLERPTLPLTSPEDYASWALNVAHEILTKSAATMPPLCGIGVAVPGLVTNSPAEIKDVPGTVKSGESWNVVESVQKALAQAFNVEVLVDNDARLCVTGATWFSNGRPKYKNLAVLNLGYGLGLGLIVNGQPLRGAKGFAGEIGHIPLGRPGIPCFCGRSGCLENIASGAAIATIAQERGLPTSDVEELANMARNGDAQVQEIFSDFGKALGRAAATIINLFNPDAIILTGKVSRASDIFLAAMKEEMQAHALPAPLADTQLIVEQFSKNLTSLGAVAAVLNQIFYTSHISVEELL